MQTFVRSQPLEMIEPVRKSLSLSDGEVSYLEWPGEGPVLHFAHATGFNAETYRSMLSPLAGRFHIFASDARGHGFTTLPADPKRAATWAIYRDDLLRVIDRLSPEPIILAGHSMGATTSLMAAAASKPERIAGVVLIEPVMVPRGARVLMSLPRLLRPARANGLADRAAQRRARFPSLEAALAAYRGRGAFKSWREETLKDYLKGGLRSDKATGEVMLACAPAWESATFRAAMSGVARFARKIKSPLTLIYGTVNSTCRDAGAIQIAKRDRDARIKKVEGASHFLPMERPDIVRQEISRFFVVV